MAACRSHLAGSTGCGWLMPAAEMAGLAGASWRPSPDPALTGQACLAADRLTHSRRTRRLARPAGALAAMRS